MKTAFVNFRMIFVLLLAALLAGCSGGAAPATPTATPTTQPVPTATATPEPFAVLMAPDPAPSAAVELAVRAVGEFAAQQGWDLRRVSPGAEALGADRLGGPRLFASVGSGLGEAIIAAAQARTDIKFLAVGETGAAPSANLLVVGSDFRRDQAAFMAGLLAGIENRNDYVGWIGEDGTVRGTIYYNGFKHGIRYICPRCRLFNLALPAAADAGQGMSAAGSLLTNYIDTASAVPGPAGDAALADLAKNGVRVAGAGPDIYRTVFSGGSGAGVKNVLGEIAFRPDLLLADLLPRFLAGETFAEPVSYSLANGGIEYAAFPNDWISAARQAYLQKILDELAAGRLDIGIDPLTGDER
jgi:basic membrane lipoprotein Med (substrate-binding protein (PBP1-ABC) superfamily)